MICIVRDSKEKAHKQSILNYARAVEKDIVNLILDDTTCQFEQYGVEYKNGDIKVSGDKVKYE